MIIQILLQSLDSRTWVLLCVLYNLREIEGIFDLLAIIAHLVHFDDQWVWKWSQELVWSYANYM